MDFRSFDWDDTELIRAYNRGLEARKANKEKDNKKENKRRKWNVGDHCRAIYSVDQEYYEAKVISLNGDFCTVEFLGYDDSEDVDFAQLKESEGKKARKKQIKAAKGDSYDNNSSVNESESVLESSDVSVASHSSFRKKKHVKQTAKNTTFDTTMYEATFHQQYPVAAPAPSPYYTAPAPIPTSLPFVPLAPPATQYPVSAAPPVPQYPMSAAPPMPQCPGLANNPSLSSMLTAWYMAGYYTGLHSVQKENNGCPKCCSRSSHCCHN